MGHAEARPDLTCIGLSPLLVTLSWILFLPSFSTILLSLTTTIAPGCFSASYTLGSGKGKRSWDGMGKKLPYRAFSRSPSSELMGLWTVTR